MIGILSNAKKGNAKPASEKRSWFSRLFRGTPAPDTDIKINRPISLQPTQRQTRHRRSVSDLAYLIHSRREPPKIVDIQTMVRLSGKSILYLPQEYSPCSLILPTCIRATAQYIAQNATTRGIFRIPGSVKVVNALFDYYCYSDNDGIDVATTVCCASLPAHIQHSVHDVGSTFKRLLAVLPGGILGSLSLFDAFVAIYSQLDGEPEFPRTKQSKIRARLVALAIGTIESQFRRELICAVFGLLSLIGRVAELTPREDEEGRPLPTSDLMGYNALGIVFGPLLIGDLLDQYTMKLATPSSGLLLFPLTPRKHRRDRRKTKMEAGNATDAPTVDKILVANDITGMLISNWRDVVRQMRSMGTHYSKSSIRGNRGLIRPSLSESFIIRIPEESSPTKNGDKEKNISDDGQSSPEPDVFTTALKRRRSRGLRRNSVSRLLKKPSMYTLSPTIEESSMDGVSLDGRIRAMHQQAREAKTPSKEPNANGGIALSRGCTTAKPSVPEVKPSIAPFGAGGEKLQPFPGAPTEDGTVMLETPQTQVYLESVPPRLSSRHSQYSEESMAADAIQPSSKEKTNKTTNLQCQPSLGSPRKSRRSTDTNSDKNKSLQLYKGVQSPVKKARGLYKINKYEEASPKKSALSLNSHTNCEPTSMKNEMGPGLRKPRFSFVASEESSNSSGSPEPHNVRGDRDKENKQSFLKENFSTPTRQSRHNTGKRSYPEGSKQQELQDSSRTSEDSITTTPRQFYSLINFPSSVPGTCGEVDLSVAVGER